MASLLSAFEAVVAKSPDKIALIDGESQSITFAELQNRARSVATGFAKRGIEKGDRVLVAMPVGITLYITLCAIWTLGATAVFPEPAMGLKGVRHAAQVTQPKALCATGLYRLLRFLPEFWRRKLVRPVATHKAASTIDVDANDIALISFTSGSTGAPKAIPRSHGFLMAQHYAVAPLLASPNQEVDLVAFPVFVLVNLADGRCSVLPNWRLSKHDKVFAADLINWTRKNDVTRLLLPPVLCDILANSDLKIAHIGSIFTGGGPVFPDTVNRLRATTPDLRVVSVYGSTEAEPIAELDANDVSDTDMHAMENGAGLLAGMPVAAVTLRIRNEEIQVAGAHVNGGYLDPAQDATSKLIEGNTIWHRTGDAGRLDDKGRLWLLGRLGETCQTGTGVLHPFAVETAARFWPRLRRAALIVQGGAPVLFVEGDQAFLGEWRAAGQRFGITDMRLINEIPMDRRHRSKVDVGTLRLRV